MTSRLVVEVKGGRLARRDGLWTFTNRYGETTSKREGPFEQARSAMFALRDALEKRIPGLDHGLRRTRRHTGPGARP